MKQTFIYLTLLCSLLFCNTTQSKAQDEALIGELRLFPYDFIPMDWMECKGDILSIQTNTALFSILGTTYGGNGYTNFALPDLRGRTPIMPDGVDIMLGQADGSETEIMNILQLPAHSHSVASTVLACNNGSGNTATPGVYAVNAARGNEFSTTTNASSGNINCTVSSAGSVLPRNNMQPYVTLVWCICVSGTFPMRN